MAIPLGYSLNLRHQKQQLQNDCWATCLAMICDWRGVAITRPDILTRAPQILQSYTYGEMATCAEANKVIKTMSNGAIAFELLGTKKLEADDFMQYTNRRRVVMLSMVNHMWLITGYDGGGNLLIHNVGKDDGPELASPSIIRREMRDTMVLIQI
jgi:hypothetical protein